MLLFVIIIIWQNFMLEFYMRISRNKQNTCYKNIRDKNDLTLCLCCVFCLFKVVFAGFKDLELYLQCKKYRCKGSRAPISHYATLQSLSVFSFTKSQ